MTNDKLEYIDDDEKELIETIESVPVDQLKEADPSYAEELKRAAREHVRNAEAKMNIRISRAELDRIKKQAAKEGLKYQSLVKSVLHKYVTGQLVDANK
jgi:predicted DNA binding CopG/RHH family protein